MCIYGMTMGYARRDYWMTLVPMYSGKGLGRGAIESLLKASFADMFPGQAPEAFSNYMIIRGVTTAASYLIIPELDGFHGSEPGDWIMCLTGVALGLAAIPMYSRSEALARPPETA